MRLLLTADPLGGVWTYSVELAAALAPHAVEVHVATMGRALSPTQRQQCGVFAGVWESDLPLEWMPDPWAGVDAAGEWLLELESRLQPDVVQLGGYAHAALPWDAPTVLVAHSDVLSWWRAVRGAAAPPEWDEYRRRVRAGLSAAGRVVAPTAAVAADLSREYGFDGAAVVPNCRRPPAQPQVPKEPYVLAAGRVWDEAKNLRVLAELDVPVVVAGEGELAGVRTLGVLPPDQLAHQMSRAAVYAAPAVYEPFGLAILEAAQAGCALVLGDLPSLRELWGDAAAYTRDVPSLQAAVAAALCDPQAGQRARVRAQRYLPERTAAGYLEIYARLPVARVGAR